MIVKITSKRQVTFPAHVLEAMGVGPGDRLEIVESPEGYLLKPKRIDHSKLKPSRIDYSKLAPLKASDTGRTRPPFDIQGIPGWNL